MLEVWVEGESHNERTKETDMTARTRILTLAASLVVLAAAQAGAQPTPRIHRREARQEQRIQMGIATGTLTVPEARYLQTEQRSIRAREARAKSDGFVGLRERARIRHEQRVANRDIARLEHNRRQRGN
jgi:hypothetical protein